MAIVPDCAQVVEGMSLPSNEVANISKHETNSAVGAVVGADSFLEDNEMSEGR